MHSTWLRCSCRAHLASQQCTAELSMACQPKQPKVVPSHNSCSHSSSCSTDLMVPVSFSPCLLSPPLNLVLFTVEPALASPSLTSSQLGCCCCRRAGTAAGGAQGQGQAARALPGRDPGAVHDAGRLRVPAHSSRSPGRVPGVPLHPAGSHRCGVPLPARSAFKGGGGHGQKSLLTAGQLGMKAAAERTRRMALAPVSRDARPISYIESLAEAGGVQGWACCILPASLDHRLCKPKALQWSRLQQCATVFTAC